MALEPRTISINFVSGLDQKTDDKLTAKLLTADNAVLRKNGTIEKRLGFVSAGTWSISANPVKAFPFNNGIVELTDYATDLCNDSYTNSSGTFVSVALGNNQHVVSRVNNVYMAQEPTYPCTIKASSLLVNSSTIGLTLGFQDVALCGVSATQSGFIVGTDDQNFIITSPIIYDIDTGEKSFAQIPYSLYKFRAVSLTSTSQTAVISGFIATANTTLVFCNASATSVSSNVSATLLGVQSNGGKLDLAAIGSKVYFAACQVTTQSLIVGSYDPATAALSSTVVTLSQTAIQEITIATPQANTDRVRVFWRTNGSTTGFNCFMASYSFTLSQILAPTGITVGVPLFNSSVSQIVEAIGAVENVGATSVLLGFSNQSNTATQFSMSTYYTAWQAEYSNTAATVVGNLAPTINTGVCGYMTSKPFIAHGRPSMMVGFSSTGQSAQYLMTTAGGKLLPVGRCLYGVAGPYVIGAWPGGIYFRPSVVKASEDLFYTSAWKSVSFRGINGNIFSNVGSALLTMNLSQTQPIPFVTRQDCTYLGGGYLGQYDGLGKTEVGLLTSPQIVTVSQTTGLSGSITSGLYSIVIAKEITDQGGYTHLGTPSVPYTVTSAATGTSFTVSWIDGPNSIGVMNRIGQIKYAIFRTQSNGSIYYRDQTVSITSGVGTSFTPATQNLSRTDSSLATNDVIYTQGGTLPHFTPDSCDVMFLHRNRLFCNDPADETMLRFSNEFSVGEGPAFSILATVKIPGSGRLTGGASLDSNAIVFRKRSILAFSGDGPDETGLNGSFSDGQILFSDVGCVDSRNICRFRDGIVFKSPDKGFHLLTRDLQLHYVGADVEDYNSKTVVSSEVVALSEVDGAAEECRFLCSDGTLLIYNYYNQQWTTASLPGCTDAVQNGGSYFVVNTSSTVANARVFQQSLTTYVDSYSNTSATYQMTLETGWIKVADVQGFARVREANVIGKSLGAGDVSFEVGYDFETSYNETHTISMSTATAANYTGGATAVAQFNVNLTRQKCEAVRLRIKDIPTAGNTSGVFKLTNISFECAVKSGMFRLPTTKNI